MRSIFKAVVLAGVFVALVNVVPAPASAVELNHEFVVGGDIGFNLDPDLFAMALIGEYHVTSNVALGPLVTFGVANDYFLFTTSGIAKYKANLSENEKLKPYGLLGVGFLVRNEKEKDDWDRETTFLFPIGGGFEYWVQEKLAVGANVVFNISEDIYLGAFMGLRTRF